MQEDTIKAHQGERVRKEKEDFCNSDMTLKVYCGTAKGVLFKNKLAKGASSKCIKDDKGQWLTPRQFELKGGRGKSKKWKQSIYSNTDTLETLIKKGILPNPPRIHLKRNKDARQYLWKKKVTEFSQLCGRASLGNDDGMPHSMAHAQPSQEEKTPRWLSQFHSSGISVHCGVITGVLYPHRFVAGPLKKSIRMEERWCSPEEFVGMNEITNGSWATDIHANGVSLQDLIENGSLKIHQEDCSCRICKGSKWAENDDTCAVCKKDGFLICCDSCPRSFHKICHLPDISTSKKWICIYCKIENQFSVEPATCMEKYVLRCSMTPQQQLNCAFLFLKVSCQDPRVFAKKSIKKVKWNLQQDNYKTVGCFINDMRNIFKYFQNSVQDEMEPKLEDEFEKNFKEVFAIK